MTDDPEAELANWRALLESPGWHLLKAYASKHYGARATLEKLRSADTDAMRAVMAQSEAIDDVMAFPKQRLDTLGDRLAKTEPVPLVARRA